MSDRDRDRYDARDKPIFCGNFEYGASAKEIESLFEKYGPLERVDMKTGFAFVYMKDRRDADDAIHALDRREFGYRRRRLRVEWAKGDGEVKRREDLRRRQTAPTTTLFVVNFDTDRTRERDLEDAFGEFGRLKRVQIKRNYAFVQFEQVEQANAAIKALHQTKLNGRVISVEFVAREADGRNMSEDRSDRGGFNSRRSRSRSPVRARSRSPSYGRRSRSPVRRGRSPSRSPVRKRTPVSRSPVRRDSPPRRSRSRSRSALRDRSPVRRSSRSVSRSLSP